MIGVSLLNYEIQAKLGEGGQGTAYKALDTKLGRTVVVKVLPSELTANTNNLKRFEREARLASSLDHPNICTIFELNETGGHHFIAMQFIEGRTVRDLVRGKPLELKSALLLAIQVTDALAAAHARGIVHRDIKAHNVMVTDTGTVKVLDFGLAKLLDEEAARSAGMHSTEVGSAGNPYGTATYAAPEQSRGENADARADIFSTGVLLYEMLTGTWPFHGKNSMETRMAVLNSTPKPIAEFRSEATPARLQEIIDRALAKEAKDRYQKMTEFGDDLRQVLREISGVGADAGFIDATAPRHLNSTNPISRAFRWLRNAAGVRTPNTSPSAQRQTTAGVHTTLSIPLERPKTSIAILPFKNLKNDREAAFYEFALADAVIMELAKVRSLVVRPSSVIARYQGKTVDPREVGQELKASAVLAAGFIHSGERFRVTAQLIDVATGDILWSDRIDTDAGDIISVQDTIAQRIVDGLRVELSPDERENIASGTTRNSAAYEQFLRGRDFFGRYIFSTLAFEDCDRAIEHFQQAIKLDPKFAMAYGGLGACYANRVFKGTSGAEDYERAETAFEQALALSPLLAEARMLMVFVYLWRGRKEKARSEVALMLEQAPNEAVVYFVKSIVNRLDGEYDKAKRSLDKLVALDPPAKAVALYHKTLISIFQGRPQETQQELEELKRAEPKNPMILAALALSSYYAGDVAAATSLVQQVVSNDPNVHGMRPLLAICYAAQDQRVAAVAELTEPVLANAAADYDNAYWVASTYALTGDESKALEWLARAIALGNENRVWFETDPNWSSLHNVEGFKDLSRQISTKSPDQRTKPGG